MRQKLSNLCKQESGGNREFDLTLGDPALTLAKREQELQQQQCTKNNNNRSSTQESSAVKEVAMEVDGSACREEEEEAAAAVVSDDSEAKWYCNPMLQTGEHYFEMCTPEYDDPLFPICHHDKKEEQDNLQEQRQWQQQQWKESKDGLLQKNLQKTAAGPQDGAAVETRKHQFAHHSNKKQSKIRMAAESGSSSAEVVAEQLLEELERAAGKVKTHQPIIILIISKCFTVSLMIIILQSHTMVWCAGCRYGESDQELETVCSRERCKLEGFRSEA
jgi:hypothetical protein